MGVQIFNFKSNSFDLCVQEFETWYADGQDRQVRFNTTNGNGTLRATQVGDHWDIYLTMDPDENNTYGEQTLVSLHKDEMYHLTIANSLCYGGHLLCIEQIKKVQPIALLPWMFGNVITFGESDLFWDEVRSISVVHNYNGFRWAGLGDQMIAMTTEVTTDVYDLLKFCKFLLNNTDRSYIKRFEPFSSKFQFFIQQMDPRYAAHEIREEIDD